MIRNTILSRGRGANLSSWNDREGMVFANNVIYTDGGDALRFPGGSKRVTVAGNVVAGRVSGVDAGFIFGKGLGDFEGVTWDGKERAAAPRAESPPINAGDARFRVEFDLAGRRRGERVVAGACDAR